MTEQPLVSIVTPSYNQASFLEAAICSVLDQDYPHIEYWVMDGGSTDGSVEIIQRYKDRISGWVSEPDSGQADAINKGFDCSTGEIIAWLNSDDLYRPGALKSAVAVFEQHPEVGLVYSDVDSIDSSGALFNRMTYAHYQLEDLMAFNIIGQPGVFFRRSALEKAGQLDPSYHYLLDHHLWLRIALITSLKYVPGEVWSAARMHPGAKNVAHAEEFGEEAFRLAKWMHIDQRFAPYIKEISHRVWAGAHRINAFYLLDGGKPGASLKAYWRGFWQYPPAVLQDWRRILFAILSPFKPEKYRDRYRKNRQDNLLRGQNDKT